MRRQANLTVRHRHRADGQLGCNPAGLAWGFSPEARSMTQAFSAAIATAAKLPPEEQDVLASILLKKIGSKKH